MKRIELAPRPDWQAQVEAQGLAWHTASGAPYWNEAAAYVLTSDQVAVLEQATRDLYAMFITAGQYVVDNRLFDRFGIPDWAHDLVAASWKAEPPCLNFGRFDLGYDGVNPPVLFEFNCDTPTSLLEAAVVQWAWKEQVFPKADQFNSLHDKLVAKWRDITPYISHDVPVHFSHALESTGEEAVTTAYLMDTAREAGVPGIRLLVSEIGWDGRSFRDLEGREIRTLYKLYPWEWLVAEPFGRHVADAADRTLWIEPIWKMIWSSKAILPILWDLFPRHPNLLWASAEGPAGDSYVSKPVLGREGGNVTVVRQGRTLAAKDGPYGGGRMIWQGLFDLPDFGGARPVLGSWIVDGEPAGVGIREDGLITSNLSRFTPHILAD